MEDLTSSRPLDRFEVVREVGRGAAGLLSNLRQLPGDER